MNIALYFDYLEFIIHSNHQLKKFINAIMERILLLKCINKKY